MVFKYVLTYVHSHYSLSVNYIYRFGEGKDPYENRQCSIFTTMLQRCRGLVVEEPPPTSTTNREDSDGDLFEDDGSRSVCFNVGAGLLA